MVSFPATWDQTKSFGRHIVSYTMGGISMAMALHLINDTQGHDAAGAVTQITTGIASIAAGLSTLIALAMGVWASIQQSPLWQLLNGAKALIQGTIDPKTVPLATQKAMVAATDQLPTVVNVVAEPAVANAISSNTVVSSAEVKVVQK